MRCAELAALERQLADSLAAMYFVGGEERLLVQEAGDAIRRRARKLGVGERERHVADRAFPWASLADMLAERSLFSARRLIEIEMPERLAASAAKALAACLAAPGSANCLLLIGYRMRAEALSAAWCRRVERAGVVFWAKPVAPRALPAWLQRRGESLSLRIDDEAARVLAEHAEGNLLAAAQELEKLSMLLGECASVSAEQIVSAQPDSALYQAWQLRDAAIRGDSRRCVSVLRGLRASGFSPLQPLGAMAHELRTLAKIAWRRRRGQPLASALRDERVWPSRQAAMSAALSRLRLETLHRLLRRAGQIERAAKGAAAASPWDELERLALHIAARMRARPAQRANPKNA